MLFSYSKRKVVIDTQQEILFKKIASLSISDEDKESILKDFKSLQRSLAKADFKLKRTVVDKDIVANVLKQNVDTLQQKNEIIKEQVAFKEQILANVNHELRTPLNAIIGMCGLLQNTTLDNKQKEYTDLIKRSSNSLFIIINDFLTVSSMKAGKFELRKKPFTLHEVSSDLYNIFSIQTDQLGIDLIIDGAGISNETFLGDATRIHQIFQNLLNNAIKFTKEGYVKMSFRLKEDLGKNKLIEFIVEDTGIGIPADKQADIFDSFTQAHTARDGGYAGTGLGLNIVRYLIHEMDGSISLESEENVGSKFIIEIPFEHIECNPSKKKDKLEEQIIPDHWKEFNILMIEDNKANIFYAKELFRRWGLNLAVSESYKAGLNKAIGQEYDLILCDLNFPDGYGLDLIKEIRTNQAAKSNKSKIAVITASILKSDKDKAAKLDIYGYVEKPFSPAKLLAELHKIFDSQKENIDLATDKKDRPTGVYFKEKLNKISSDPKVHLEFLNIFLSQFKQDFGSLGEAVLKREYEEIYSIAHKMKSSIKFVDSDMHKHVSLLEQYGHKNETFDLINKQYQHLFRRSKMTIPELETIVVNLSTSLDT